MSFGDDAQKFCWWDWNLGPFQLKQGKCRNEVSCVYSWVCICFYVYVCVPIYMSDSKITQNMQRVTDSKSSIPSKEPLILSTVALEGVTGTPR